MTIRPRQDRVIVKRITAEEAPPSGIIIPDVAKEKPIEGEVLAVGNGDHHIDPPGGRAGRESAGRREHGRSGRHRPDGAGGFHALARNLVQRRAAVWPLELAAARRVGGEHGAHEAPLHIHGPGNRGRRGRPGGNEGRHAGRGRRPDRTRADDSVQMRPVLERGDAREGDSLLRSVHARRRVVPRPGGARGRRDLYVDSAGAGDRLSLASANTAAVHGQRWPTPPPRPSWPPRAGPARPGAHAHTLPHPPPPPTPRKTP